MRILPALVRGSLEAIASSEPGVLIHCAAGRDRTGMVSALLLADAGVSEDNTVADYSESVRQASWTPEEVTIWLSEVAAHVCSFVSDADAALEALANALSLLVATLVK